MRDSCRAPVDVDQHRLEGLAVIARDTAGRRAEPYFGQRHRPDCREPLCDLEARLPAPAAETRHPVRLDVTFTLTFTFALTFAFARVFAFALAAGVAHRRARPGKNDEGGKQSSHEMQSLACSQQFTGRLRQPRSASRR